MLVIWLLRLVCLVGLVGAVAWLGYNIWRATAVDLRHNKRFENYNFSLTSLVGPAILGIVSVIGLGMFMSAVHVGGRERAVVENTTNGTFKVLGPGIHVWPFSSDLVPFASKTTVYDLQRKEVKIGDEDPPSGVPRGIASGSSSVGNSAVFIQGRMWAAPNPDNKALIQLHRLYGPGFLQNWVEQNMVTTVKAVQGQNPYDYLIENRERFADTVEDNVQRQLVVDDVDDPLVEVSQFAVTNFDFDQQTNARLQELASGEFNERKAVQDRAVAEQERAAAEYRAETAQNVAFTEADTAKGVAQRQADAKIEEARGEAESIRQVQAAISANPNYLQYKWIETWNGQLPQYTFGDGAGASPLLNIPAPAGG